MKKIKFLPKVAMVLTVATMSFSAKAEVAVLYGLDLTDDSHYAYGGIVAPIGQGSSLNGGGWRIRGWLYDLGYEYDRALGQPDVDADASGVELGIGKQWVSGSTRSAVYLSLAHRNTDTSPNDPLNEADGSDTGLKIQGEITGQVSTNWMMQAMASYTGGDDFDDSWMRLRAGYNSGNLTFGPEIIALDGPDYNANRIGLFIDGMKIGNSTNISVSFGAHDGSRSGDSGYLNVGFITTF